MTTESDIRQLVGRFIRGDITLRTLRSRVTPLRWDAENPLDERAMQILRPLTRYFAEYSNGDWTEDDLRTQLIPFGPLVIVTLASRPKSEYVSVSSARGGVVSVIGSDATTVSV